MRDKINEAYEKLLKNEKENINESNKSTMKKWFNAMWTESENRSSLFGEGMRTVLNSFRATFLS